MTSVGDFIVEVGATTKALKNGGRQIQDGAAKTRLRELATAYFQNVRPAIAQLGEEVGALDQIFQSLHTASRTTPSRSGIVSALKDSRKWLVACESASIAGGTNAKLPQRNPADDLIVSSLKEICPSASAAYEQALLDLSAVSRLSWRGPATDLREAMRETLDVLAPDADVRAMPGFKLEGDAKRPTMKQKVRYVLKNRDVTSGAMAAPEKAVAGVEEIVGGLTRSVYDRSSVSTHTATDRSEVVRVLSWVRVVLCELLEVPQ